METLFHCPSRKFISTVTHVFLVTKGVEEVYRPREQRGPPAPVNVGDTHDVKIESKGKGGDGIARIQGFVVFVPGTNPGDEIKVRISAVQRRFATAEVVTE
ncbi:MAG: TRAM domain-containing protein [Hadesarchaea archaeon]|nr:TRAM domain-containing protein [Hadesarchaea archaeon]